MLRFILHNGPKGTPQFFRQVSTNAYKGKYSLRPPRETEKWLSLREEGRYLKKIMSINSMMEEYGVRRRRSLDDTIDEYLDILFHGKELEHKLALNWVKKVDVDVVKLAAEVEKLLQQHCLETKENSVAYQQSLYGSLLRDPFPIFNGNPCIEMERPFRPEVVHELRTRLRQAHGDANGRTLIGIPNVSGGGKTKSCFSIGIEDKPEEATFAILFNVGMQGKTSETILHVEALIKRAIVSRDKLLSMCSSKEEQYRVYLKLHTIAVNAVRLIIAAHIEFAILVNDAVFAKNPKNKAAENNALARRAVLSLLKNGGRACVIKLFDRHSHMLNAADGAVGEYMERLVERAHDTLRNFVIFYDEVLESAGRMGGVIFHDDYHRRTPQAVVERLQKEVKGPSPESHSVEEENVIGPGGEVQKKYTQSTDLFYALRWGMMDFLLTNKGVAQIMTDTHVRILQRILDHDPSPTTVRVFPFYELEPVTFLDIEKYVCGHFSVELPLPDNIVVGLCRFVGRPRWFFGIFVSSLLATLRNKPAHTMPELYSAMLKDSDRACEISVGTMERIVTGFLEITTPVGPTDAIQVRQLLDTAYYHLKMHDGKAVLSDSEVKGLIENSIFMLTKAPLKSTLDLHSEPIAVTGLLKAYSAHNYSAPIERDRVMEYLRWKIAGTGATNSGTFAEEVYAWIFVRLSRTFRKALDLFKEFGMVNIIPHNSWLAAFSIPPLDGVVSDKDLEVSTLDAFTMCGNRALIVKDSYFGADCLVNLESAAGLLGVLSCQFKAAMTSDIVQALRTTHPDLWYHTKEERATLVAGEVLPKKPYYVNLVAARDNFFSTHQHMRERFVRVLINSNGFQHQAIQTVNAYNTSPQGLLRPVVLMKPNANVLGKHLHHLLCVGDISESALRSDQLKKFEASLFYTASTKEEESDGNSP